MKIFASVKTIPGPIPLYSPVLWRTSGEDPWISNHVCFIGNKNIDWNGAHRGAKRAIAAASLWLGKENVDDRV